MKNLNDFNRYKNFDQIRSIKIMIIKIKHCSQHCITAIPGFEFFRDNSVNSNNSYKLALPYRAGTGRYTMPLPAS